MYDSGATDSIINKYALPPSVKGNIDDFIKGISKANPYGIKLVDVNVTTFSGKYTERMAYIELPFRMENYQATHGFLIAKCQSTAILGRDLCSKHKIFVDDENNFHFRQSSPRAEATCRLTRSAKIPPRHAVYANIASTEPTLQNGIAILEQFDHSQEMLSAPRAIITLVNGRVRVPVTNTGPITCNLPLSKPIGRLYPVADREKQPMVAMSEVSTHPVVERSELSTHPGNPMIAYVKLRTIVHRIVIVVFLSPTSHFVI